MAEAKPVIVVTGTLREGAVLKGGGIKGGGIEVIAGGGDEAGLTERLQEAAPRAAGIISFGMAGAIDRSLRIGDWVIGKRLTGVAPTNSDERWVHALHRGLPHARIGAIHAEGRLFACFGDKEDKAGRSAALAVDMESHVAAAAAEWAAIPFVALRCISDIAETELPAAVMVAMRPGGGLAVGAVLRSMATHPGQIPALAGTLGGFVRAYRELSAGAKALEPRLGFDAR